MRSLFDLRSATARAAIPIFLSAAFCLNAPCPAAELPESKRTYQAVRLTGDRPVIDGKLDDAAWELGKWSGGFRQREPFEGAPPSAPTEIKILYDNRAIYVAVRAYDPEIATQPRLLGERDEISGDVVGIAFDSYLDRRTAFEFDVNSGGTKIDLILRNDGSTDEDWNAVWDVKVAADAQGWTAEYRIPLSQLRYSNAKDQVWGLHSWRWIRRAQEESNWQLIPMDHQGMVRAFGELRGIGDLPRSRRIELMPYAVLKHESLAREAGNPYRSGGTTDLTGGLDAKVGLSSDFTLGLTVNPDFGQVEADPSEINLGTVETFFPEKRPFFVEGSGMFEFELDDDLPFYSRRIGDAPSMEPIGPGFVQMPANVRIVTAEKVTGRTAGGFSLGVLHAMTAREEMRITEPGREERRQLAEPRTHSFVARAQDDFADGDTLVGGIFTATLRDGDERELRTLPRQALTAGVDATHYWSDRTYYLEARGLVTQIKGSPEAITDLMEDSVHNYQRPDADHLGVDLQARELSGHAGRLRVGKGSNGRWRYYGEANWRSPGVDFNDLGYLAEADFFQHAAQLEYYDAESGGWLRRRELRLRQASTYSFGGETLEHEFEVEAEVAGLSNWSGAVELGVETARLDPRVLRGGPALRQPVKVPFEIEFETDEGRRTQFAMEVSGSVTPEDRSHEWEIEPEIAHRFGDHWSVGLEVGYAENRQESQYVGQAALGANTRYVMGRMEQTTLSAELRLQANFSPTLSLTYFAGPYLSRGRFDRFKVVAAPRASGIDDRFARIASRKTGDGYEGRLGAETFQFDDPDFHWRELRSNLVLRWEFRPGSVVYAVWSQHRADDADAGAFEVVDEYRRLFDVQPDNTFLVKFSYWFSI